VFGQSVEARGGNIFFIAKDAQNSSILLRWTLNGACQKASASFLLAKDGAQTRLRFTASILSPGFVLR